MYMYTELLVFPARRSLHLHLHADNTQSKLVHYIAVCVCCQYAARLVDS